MNGLIKIEDMLFNEVVKIRRDLHEIPESGNKEFLTTEYIWNYVKQLGLEPVKGPEGTGVIAFLEVAPGSKAIAFRADIDGLSVEEKTDHCFKSKREGYMHACGHDGHMANLLGFMKLITEKRQSLKKNFLFIFQPAEEGPGGAESIVKSGLLTRCNVEAIIGMHIFPDLNEGLVGCRNGALMAGTGEFDIKILGKSGHGAMPYKGIDAMNAACHLVNAINTVIGRNIDPVEPAVLSVGKLVSGERRNIIAGEAVLEGTMRAFSEDTLGKLKKRLETLVKNIPEAFDCSIESEIRIMYPPTVNDEGLVKKLAEICGKSYVELSPLTISEDFSYYQKQVPGVFFMLGARNEKAGYMSPLHNNRFDFDEKILKTSLGLFYAMAERLDGMRCDS